ncbi:sugar phosphate isomerase/epimerase family protein [Arthrobacter castelli]|uniref:sugar phosphate isomerase/epimerase family protein n=1 Tax=Arthrobacter castelli TaxID=271431 RepID=UPI000417E802|nr:sugar phosphate isomerase/epimerase [Arthrobacter castelli]
MTYSLQLYTVREALNRDLHGTIRQIAALGYEAVEPFNFVALANELSDALASSGLSAPSGHAPLLQADQDEIFAAAKRLGISTVIDPHVPAENWQSEDNIVATARSLNDAARRAAPHGIRVGYHNHAFELEARIGGRSGLEVLAENLDPEVVLEVDTYWAAVGGEDVPALLGRLGDRVKLLHIKDGPLTKDDKEQTAVGAGRMPVWDCIDAAGSLETAVVELDDFSGDVFDAIADSYTYLKAGK